jgi:hypothetical protein
LTAGPQPPEAPPTILFHEPGASWLWLLAGPVAGAAMAFIQNKSGSAMDLTVPLIFFVVVTGFLLIQVKAARIHTSIELTPEYLRQGAETIRVEEIVKIFPPATGDEAPKWQSARALGELTGVPRGRTGIGLKLSSDRTAQAWAKRHRQLRTTLNSLVDERMP